MSQPSASTGLQVRLARACHDLELEIHFPATVHLFNGARLTPVAVIPHLAGYAGMVVVTSYDKVREHRQDLAVAGYGFSVLDEPRPDEVYDLASLQDMFVDWGWYGDSGSRPSWMPQSPAVTSSNS